MIGQFFSDAKRVIIKNVSGEEIPARSFIKVTGGEKLTSGQECLHGDKPNGEGSVYVVSGLAVIPAGGIGYGFWPSSPVWVKYSTQPVPVEEVGPESGNWECDPDGSGFDCLRIKDGLALIIGSGSGGGNGTTNNSGSCDCGEFVRGTDLTGSSATVCCDSHERWRVRIGSTWYTLFYQNGDTWSTYNPNPSLDNPLTVTCCDQGTTAGTSSTAGTSTTSGTTTTCEQVTDRYDLVMEASNDRSTITLVARSEEHCCYRRAVYARGRFACQASQRFELEEFCNIGDLALPRCLCVQPDLSWLSNNACAGIPVPSHWRWDRGPQFEFTGYDTLPDLMSVGCSIGGDLSDFVHVTPPGTLMAGVCGGSPPYTEIIGSYHIAEEALKALKREWVIPFYSEPNCQWKATNSVSYLFSNNYPAGASTNGVKVCGVEITIDIVDGVVLGTQRLLFYIMVRMVSTNTMLTEGFADATYYSDDFIPEDVDLLVDEFTLTISTTPLVTFVNGSTLTFPSAIQLTPYTEDWIRDNPPTHAGYCGEDCPDCDEQPPTTTEGTSTTRPPILGGCCIAELGGMCVEATEEWCDLFAGVWHETLASCDWECEEEPTTTAGTSTTAGTTTTSGTTTTADLVWCCLNGDCVLVQPSYCTGEGGQQYETQGECEMICSSQTTTPMPTSTQGPTSS